MTLRLVDAGWSAELSQALNADTSGLRLISPFIKLGALERLLAFSPQPVQVITRYNLDDFASGVSDIAALRRVLAAGGQVRGIRNLHAKLYLFGASRAVVTSANLTAAALDRNQEFGAVTQDSASVASCRAYFDRLWQLGAVLQPGQLDAWEQAVRKRRAAGVQAGPVASLGDYGADAGFQPAPVPTALPAADASRAFVKFLGQSSNRVPLTFPVEQELARAGCHRVLAYPNGKRPRQVQDGALMFVARLTEQPTDITIFGRAIGMAHVDGIDDATPAEIALPGRGWRAEWPHYVRVHGAEFVAGTMANGVSLNDLKAALGANAFASTQRNAAMGKGNTDPHRAYLRAAQVELSPEGLAWLRDRLQQAFDAHGVVPRDVLAALP